MATLSSSTRRLVWVPIIHTPADLGSLSGSVRELYVRKIGQAKWDQHIQGVQGVWAAIREAIEGLALTYREVRLYQDGLPNCGHEGDIVRDLARAGSENHLLLQDLVKRGATLMGTEAPELLLQEYELARQVVVALETGQAGGLAHRQRELSRQLLDKRDHYIAERIAATLESGETGLLFLGLLHSLDGRLPTDIRVTRLGGAPRHSRKATHTEPSRQRSQDDGQD